MFSKTLCCLYTFFNHFILSGPLLRNINLVQFMKLQNDTSHCGSLLHNLNLTKKVKNGIGYQARCYYRKNNK